MLWLTNSGNNISRLNNIFSPMKCGFIREGGYINDQNYQIWSAEKPNTYWEVGLQLEKVGVRCSISKCRIIGPKCLQQWTSCQWDIIMQFMALLTPEELGGVMAHTAAVTTNFLLLFFGDRLISKGLWPRRSQDMTLDFFLWSRLKMKILRVVYQHHWMIFVQGLRKKWTDHISSSLTPSG